MTTKLLTNKQKIATHKKIQSSGWEKVRGMWKNKKGENPVQYQQTLRSKSNL